MTYGRNSNRIKTHLDLSIIGTWHCHFNTVAADSGSLSDLAGTGIETFLIERAMVQAFPEVTFVKEVEKCPK